MDRYPTKLCLSFSLSLCLSLLSLLSFFMSAVQNRPTRVRNTLCSHTVREGESMNSQMLKPTQILTLKTSKGFVWWGIGRGLYTGPLLSPSSRPFRSGVQQQNGSITS